MKRPAALIVVCLLAVTAFGQAKKEQVTVRFGGAHCDDCVPILRQAVAKAKDFKLDPAAIKPGEARRFFSPLVPLTLLDADKSNLGALAKIVAAAPTPHRQEHPPRLYLTLFGEVDEPAVIALRASLRDVPGTSPDAPGSIGGFPNEGTFWVRLDGDGQANLDDIRRGLKEGMAPASLKKP